MFDIMPVTVAIITTVTDECSGMIAAARCNLAGEKLITPVYDGATIYETGLFDLCQNINSLARWAKGGLDLVEHGEHGSEMK